LFLDFWSSPADNDVEYTGCADEPADEYVAGIQKIWSDAAAGSWNASAALAPEDAALDPVSGGDFCTPKQGYVCQANTH
jgi:hypothetical protein